MSLSYEAKRIYMDQVRDAVLDDVKPFNKGVMGLMSSIGKTDWKGWVASAALVSVAATFGQIYAGNTGALSITPNMVMTTIFAGYSAMAASALIPIIARTVESAKMVFNPESPESSKNKVIAKFENELLKVNPNFTKQELGSIMEHGNHEIINGIKDIHKDYVGSTRFERGVSSLYHEMNLKAEEHLNAKAGSRPRDKDSSNDGLSR